MHHSPSPTVISTFSTAVRLNLEYRSFLYLSWTKHIRLRVKLGLESASNQPIHIEGTTDLKAHLGDVHFCVTFGDVFNFSVPILLSTLYIDQLFPKIFPLEQQIVLFHWRPPALLASYSYKNATNATVTDNQKTTTTIYNLQINAKPRQPENWSIPLLLKFRLNAIQWNSAPPLWIAKLV